MNIIVCNEVNLFFFFSVLFLSFQTALTIVFTKFGRNLRFDGLLCVADNIVFQAENVSKSLACIKICYNNMLSDAIFYQPDLLTCIGCAGIYHFAEVLPGSTYFARPSGKGHQDWIGHGNSYYYFSPDKKNWNDALATCRKLGSDLVEVNDVTENNFSVLNNNDNNIGSG
ncbi:uncharacterized protein LOC123562538 [Mercenaria mercenaria]|uniref:uncharacterized protein LOC123562538 n=1 Tax=Mercenaria mercenaria TaxID=6596 RepID=UPI00234F1DC7|nr:uncharacterized protein LOC123562538 [Mercenaria mercenaria]